MNGHHSLKQVLRWLVAIICVSYVVYFFVHNRGAFSNFLKFSPISILAISGLYIGVFFLQSYRYGIMIQKCSGSPLPKLQWFRIFIVSTFLSHIFPQTGNIYRAVQLKSRFQVSYTRYISSYLSLIWLDILVNIVVSLILILSVKPGLTLAGINAGALLSGLLILVSAAPGVGAFADRWFGARITYFHWLHSKISEVFAVTLGNIHDLRFMAKIVATGIVSFSISICIFYVCFAAIGSHVDVSVLALFAVLLKLSHFVVLTPGNVGFREVAYGVLGDIAGIGMGPALVVSIVTRLVSTCLILLTGLCFGGAAFLSKPTETENDA